MKVGLLFVSLFLFLSLHTDQIQPITEPWTPYQMQTSKGLEGISVDLVKEIQKRIGNTKEIKVFPWKRGYNLTLNKKGYALFLTTRSKKREDLFKWVGPVASMKIAFFKKSDRNDLKINTLEDAKKVESIVVAQDTIEHEKLTELGFTNLKVNTLSNLSLQNFKESRVDLYPTEYYSFMYKIKLENLQNEITPVAMKEPIYESKLYLAFNIQTDDETINRWQKALDEIKVDGTYEMILQRYK